MTAVEYCGGPSMVFRMGREDLILTEEPTTDLSIIHETHENAIQSSRFE